MSRYSLRSISPSTLRASEADYRGRLGCGERDYRQARQWRAALAAAQTVDAGGIAGIGMAQPGVHALAAKSPHQLGQQVQFFHRAVR